jgi:uncharacterized protein (TIGR02118 family)
MIKVLVQIRKKDGISMEEFIHYYEEKHVPLINSLLPYYAGYERNYLVDVIYPKDLSNDFDVITELLFSDEAAYSAWGAALQDDAVVARISADEANFIDSVATRMWRVCPEKCA